MFHLVEDFLIIKNELVIRIEERVEMEVDVVFEKGLVALNERSRVIGGQRSVGPMVNVFKVEFIEQH